MSTTTFPSDKEIGETNPFPTEKPAELASEDDDVPSTRQILFLLSLLWLSWFIGAVFDTVLEIDRRLWSYEPLSPLQQHVYSKKWDEKLIELDYFYILTQQSMSKIVVTCFTLFTIFMFAFSRAMPITDCITASSINLLSTLSFGIGAFLGVDEKEAVFIALPIGLLIGFGVAAYLKRVGKDALDARFGLPKKAARWCRSASFSVPFVTYACFYRIGNDMMILFALYEGLKLVYVWLG